MKITPEQIEDLQKNEIFVFGSNESGIHGAGAAFLAEQKFGAYYGQGFGLMNNSFGIPTKDWQIKTLPLNVIKNYVDRFIAFTELQPTLEFLVTKIGCGLAGYTVEEIAPLFSKCINKDNIYLPQEFIDINNDELKWN